MTHRPRITSSLLLMVALVPLVACASTPKPVHAERAVGPAQGPPGRVLVVSATCGNLDEACRNQWAPSVDQIVISALEFRGYSTIDPTTLRKDPATRTETTATGGERVDTRTDDRGVSGGLVGPIPLVIASARKGHTVTVTESQHRTVIVEGATYDELPIEDRRALLELAGAGSVLTTRVIVGASYGTWTTRQDVEVLVKLSDARDGTMRWSARCRAESHDHASANEAIEAAARCAAHEIAQVPPAAP